MKRCHYYGCHIHAAEAPARCHADTDAARLRLLPIPLFADACHAIFMLLQRHYAPPLPARRYDDDSYDAMLITLLPPRCLHYSSKIYTLRAITRDMLRRHARARDAR